VLGNMLGSKWPGGSLPPASSLAVKVALAIAQIGGIAGVAAILYDPCPLADRPRCGGFRFVISIGPRSLGSYIP
jgi:hypothetical protein